MALALAGPPTELPKQETSSWPACLPANTLGLGACSYTSTAGMAGVFTTRPALDLLWGYEDPLLQLLATLLPPGSLQDGPRVRLTGHGSSSSSGS